jgi:hypothetical protein
LHRHNIVFLITVPADGEEDARIKRKGWVLVREGLVPE